MCLMHMAVGLRLAVVWFMATTVAWCKFFTLVLGAFFGSLVPPVAPAAIEEDGRIGQYCSGAYYDTGNQKDLALLFAHAGTAIVPETP